jgi:hypothetical protein
MYLNRIPEKVSKSSKKREKRKQMKGNELNRIPKSKEEEIKSNPRKSSEEIDEDIDNIGSKEEIEMNQEFEMRKYLVPVDPRGSNAEIHQ